MAVHTDSVASVVAAASAEALSAASAMVAAAQTGPVRM